MQTRTMNVYMLKLLEILPMLPHYNDIKERILSYTNEHFMKIYMLVSQVQIVT